MFKRLSFAAAALALATVATPALAQSQNQDQAEAAIEAAEAAFEARMEDFGARAEAISEDETLSDMQKATAIAALWAEYEPEVTAFVAQVTTLAADVALTALSEVDVASLMADIDVAGLTAEAVRTGALVGSGIAANGAWASQDPEHMQTYGLMAEYALGQAEEGLAAARNAPEAD